MTAKKAEFWYVRCVLTAVHECQNRHALVVYDTLSFGFVPNHPSKKQQYQQRNFTHLHDCFHSFGFGWCLCQAKLQFPMLLKTINLCTKEQTGCQSAWKKKKERKEYSFIYIYMLFLQTGAHSPLQSKGAIHSQDKFCECMCAHAHTRVGKRMHALTHTISKIPQSACAAFFTW